MNVNATNGKSLSRGLKKLLTFLFRVILIVIIVGIVGIAVYFGAPVLINEYLFKDVNLNTSKIQEINDDLETSSGFLTQRLSDLQTRLESLEIQNDTESQNIDELKVRISGAENSLTQQKVLAEQLSTLESTLDEYDSGFLAVEDRILILEEKLSGIQEEINTLSQIDEEQGAVLDSLAADDNINEDINSIQQELNLLKVMELLTRVRIFSSQGNIGLAKEDLRTSQEIIADMAGRVSTSQAAYLSEIAQRLTLASENMSEAPALADEDLEVAWQLLLQGFPDELDSGFEGTTTPTPESHGEIIETSTITPTLTPEP